MLENLHQFCFIAWLTQDSEQNMAFCKVCKVVLRAHKTERHAKRPLHTNNFKKVNPELSNQSTITNVIIQCNKTKEAEIRLSTFIAAHASVTCVDHLGDLIKSFPENKCDDLKLLRLHRTKCSMVIKNVIAESLKEELRADLEDSCYSLIIDESTDISVLIYQCLCIRYYSVSQRKIITQYLGLCEVVRCTAVNLAETIERFLKAMKLNLSNLTGLGTDGANNLCGSNNSVFTILKEKLPRLQLVKCTAHSLHLCASKAAEVLPSSIEFLCKEVNSNAFSFCKYIN